MLLSPLIIVIKGKLTTALTHHIEFLGSATSFWKCTFYSNKTSMRNRAEASWIFLKCFPNAWVNSEICRTPMNSMWGSLAAPADTWYHLEAHHQDVQQHSPGTEIQRRPPQGNHNQSQLLVHALTFVSGTTCSCCSFNEGFHEELGCFSTRFRFLYSFWYILCYMYYKALFSQPVLQKIEVALKILVQM